MKRVSLLILAMFCTAGIAQNTNPLEPETEMSAAEQCYTDCEYVHSGEIRACIRRPVTQGRGVQFEQCVGNSYDTLGVCYKACSQEQ